MKYVRHIILRPWFLGMLLLVSAQISLCAHADQGTCWYPLDPTYYADEMDLIRKWGAYNDPIAALNAVTPNTVAWFNQTNAPIGYTVSADALYPDSGYPLADSILWSRSFVVHVDPQLSRKVIGSPAPPWILAYRIYPSALSAANMPPDVKAIISAACFNDSHYTVRVSRLDGTTQDDTYVALVEPGKSAALLASVYDQNNQLVPNVSVTLTVSAVVNSGGHQHGDDNSPLRTGTLASSGPGATLQRNNQILTDSTGSTGLLFAYLAPKVCGDAKITAECTNCTEQGANEVWVGHQGLQALAKNDVYILLPNDNDPQHPDHLNLTLVASSRMAVLAALYHGRYKTSSVLQLNDASLKRGGIFDLHHNWKSPHFEHCQGTVIDIRANGVNGALNITGDGVHTTDDGTVHPADPMIEMLQSIAGVAGVDAVWEVPKDANGNFVWDARHFHTKLMGPEGLSCP